MSSANLDLRINASNGNYLNARWIVVVNRCTPETLEYFKYHSRNDPPWTLHMEDYCIDAIALLVSWFENRNYNEHALVGLVQGHVEDDQNERFRKGMHAHMDLYRLACVSHDYRLRQYSWDKLEAAFRRFCYPTTFDLSCWKDALNQVTPLPAQTLLGVKDPLLDLWIRIGLENLQVCRPYLLRVYPRSPTLFMARFFEVGQHLLDREQGIVSWETPFAWWSFDNLAPHLDL